MVTMTTKEMLSKMVQPKPVDVSSAISPYPQHVVVGIWLATAAVLIFPGRKPEDKDLLKVYQIAMTLLPMV